jgi:hypothetical protein
MPNLPHNARAIGELSGNSLLQPDIWRMTRLWALAAELKIETAATRTSGWSETIRFRTDLPGTLIFVLELGILRGPPFRRLR